MVQRLGEHADREARNARPEVGDPFAHEANDVLGVFLARLALGRCVLVERRCKLAKVLLAERDMVADPGGPSHLGHAAKLFERVRPAVTVLVLLCVEEKLPRGTKVRLVRIGLRGARAEAKCEERSQHRCDATTLSPRHPRLLPLVRPRLRLPRP